MNNGNESIQSVGPYMLKKVKPGPTTAGIAPTYAVCTPDRWGMRYSDLDPKRPGQLMYPLVRDFTRTMHAIFTEEVKWGDVYFGPPEKNASIRLTSPINGAQTKKLFGLFQDAMSAALTSKLGGYGLPTAAIPIVVSYTPTTLGEQGAFAAEFWRMELNLSSLSHLFKISKAEKYNSADYADQLTPLKEFTNTLYHESRHAQQSFWIFALIQQYPENFSSIPNIRKWVDTIATLRSNQTNLPQQIASMAASQPIPNDTAALISLKRMAVGQYFWVLDFWRRQNWYPPYLGSLAALEEEIQRVRPVATDLLQHVGIGGTSIDVDTMLGENPVCLYGYQERPWENDAFVCGDMVSAYWRECTGNMLQTYPADQCSNDYDFHYKHSPHPLPGGNASGEKR